MYYDCQLWVTMAGKIKDLNYSSYVFIGPFLFYNGSNGLCICANWHVNFKTK